MNRQSKRLILSILVAIALVLWGVHFILDREAAPSERMAVSEPQAVHEPIVDEDGAASELAPTGTETNEAEEPADTEVAVASAEDASNREDESGPDESQTAVETISAILNSRELKHAALAQRALRDCHNAPLTDSELEYQLANIQNMFATTGSDWDIAYHLDGALQRKYMLLEKCRGIATLRDEIWAGDLFEKAAQGDQFARFLYAMWPPRQREAFDMSMEDLLVYQSAALDFSLRNLEEGHPLGLLAFGYSYMSSRYFTPGNNRLGVAHLIAAQLCSGGQFGLQPLLDEMLATFEEHQFGTSPVSNEEILAAGTRLYDAHCATSIARSVP